MLRLGKSQVVCLLLGITLFIAGIFVENRSSVLNSGNTVDRNSYGQGPKEQMLKVDGLLGHPFPVELSISERQYGEQEAGNAFIPAYEKLIALVLGENESLLEVRTNLNLITWLEEYGIAAEWGSDDETLMNSSGEILNSDCPEIGTENYLSLRLKAGKYSRDFAVKTVIYPPVRNEDEKRIAAFKTHLTFIDKEQGAAGSLSLPEQFGGADLKYSTKKNGDPWIFLMLGIGAAILIPLRERQNAAEKKKRKERQLLLDYSEIVSKLVVFLGAGLPIRKAWERIVMDYEQKSKNSPFIRYAYEEMKNAYYLMGRGVPESRAYAEFGNRCRILPYRKLASILEQNVKNGTENLRSILETEMAEAFEQRKMLARRMGEEAGTKLLLPLFMMLAIVMVIISVPAFLSFGM